MRPGLSRMRKLLAHLDHPDHAFESVLVTGSNGKGTTCAVLASCLEAQGWTTGLFTSPHLVSVRERFRVNGHCAPYTAMERFLSLHSETCRRLSATYFETTTAFALWWFRERKVKWAVLEIGLGGRLDACNAVEPRLSIVTSISREHTAWLGNSEASIAAEKGGVARRDTPTLAGPLGGSAQRSLSRTVHAKGGWLLSFNQEIHARGVRSTRRGSRFTLQFLARRVALSVPFAGEKAVINAALAASAALWLAGVGRAREGAGWKEQLKRGVRRAYLPARLEQVQTRPRVIVDVAHNEASVASLVKDWRRLWPSKRPVVLTGLLDDKPSRKIGRLLSSIADTVVITRPDSPRAVDPALLAQQWRGRFRELDVVDSPAPALARALELAKRGSLLVTGSHYVVGPILGRLRRSGRPAASAAKL